MGAAQVVIHRRSFLVGLGASLFAAPAIVRAASIMPVRAIEDWELTLPPYGRSPMMEALPTLRCLEEQLRLILEDQICFGLSAYETGPDVPNGFRRIDPYSLYA